MLRQAAPQEHSRCGLRCVLPAMSALTTPLLKGTILHRPPFTGRYTPPMDWNEIDLLKQPRRLRCDARRDGTGLTWSPVFIELSR